MIDECFEITTLCQPRCAYGCFSYSSMRDLYIMTLQTNKVITQKPNAVMDRLVKLPHSLDQFFCRFMGSFCQLSCQD